MSETKINLTLEGNELTIREGKAAEPLSFKEPQIISIIGDIHSVSNFLKERSESSHSSQKVKRDRSVVTVNKAARSITLQLDPENHYGATVVGTLEPSEELKPFGINSDKLFRREELHKLLKFSRVFFNDKEKHSALLASLSKIRLKTETEMQAHSDSKGNRGASVEKKTINDDGFIHNFFMVAPFFKGEPPVKFPVEICYDAGDNGIMFWLESPELKEMMDGYIDQIFSKELEYCEGFVIINK